MSSTLTISGLDVAFGARTLFSGLDLTLADGDVTAVVGPNGSGKSTLMRTIVGELPIEAGSIRLAPRDATIGWLPQVVPDPSETLLTYARRRTGVTAAEAELEAASAAIAAGDEGSEDRYATALERWLALGAADLDERLPEVAARVGLDVERGPAARHAVRRAGRSGLPRRRAAQPVRRAPPRRADQRPRRPRPHPDGRLRPRPRGPDPHREPRPHLPRRGRDERRRARRQAAAHRPLHRRLERVRRTTPARPRPRVGGLRGVCRERDSLLAQSRQRHDWADKGRRNVALGKEPDKHIREKHKARADRQAAKGGRLERAADRLDAVEQPRKEWQLRYAITEGRPSADVVATLSDAVVERHGFRLGPVSLVVGRGDRIAVVGDNGSGKTTLLGALLGDLPLASGRQSLGTRVAVGIIDQRRHLLDDDATVLDVVRRELGPTQDVGEWPVAEVRTLLAKFGSGRSTCPPGAEPLDGRAHPRAHGPLPGPRGQRPRARRADEPPRRRRHRAARGRRRGLRGDRARRQPRREPARRHTPDPPVGREGRGRVGWRRS